MLVIYILAKANKLIQIFNPPAKAGVNLAGVNLAGVNLAGFNLVEDNLAGDKQFLRRQFNCAI